MSAVSAFEGGELTLWECVLVLVGTCAVLGSYVVAFSSVIGFGADTFKALRDDQQEKFMFGTSVAMALFLYIADASHWRGARTRVARDALVAAASALFMLSIGLSAHRYPQAPPTLYFIATPLVYAYFKMRFFKDRSMSSYLSAMARSLYACAGVIAMLFIAEASRTDAWWSTSLELKYRQAIGCHDDLATECLSAYVMWFSPCLAVLASLIFATFCALLASSMRSSDENSSSEKNVMNFTIKAFGSGLIFVFLGLWVAVSIAGGAKALSAILVTFSMSALVVLSGALAATVGLDAITSKVTSVPLFASIMNAVTDKYANVFKAVFLSTPLTLAFVVYLMLSFVNQRVRTIFGTAPDERSGSRWVTAKVSKQLDELQRWNWSRIMINVHYWIAVVIAFQVVAGSFTVVFLSALRVQLAAVPVVLVYIIFTFVGLAMFLIPIIPGLPVYITGGIILTDEPLVRAFGGGSKGYAWACVCAVTLCFVIKLIAVIMQQKGIGERLGNRVWIRSMVNVNSTTMRSIRFLLTKPGLNFPKVTILVGGPDWPTSVITGILRLNVVEMLIGTLPVFFLIAPTTLAGAFMLKASRAAGSSADVMCRQTSADSIVADESGPWTSIADIGLLCTGLAQGLALIAAAYFIEKTAAQERDALDAMPYDDEVLEVERGEEHRNELMRAIIQWDELSATTRRQLSFSTFMIIISFWGIMFAPSFLGEESVMREYLLTDCVSTRLDGKPWNIMTLLGWILLLVVMLSLFIVSRVNAIAKSEVDDIIADEEDFQNALHGMGPKRAWAKCPNHNEPVDEEKFRERLATTLETMSRTQIEKVRETMTERQLAPFSEETREFILRAVASAMRRVDKK